MRISDWSSDVCSSDLGDDQTDSLRSGDYSPLLRTAADVHRRGGQDLLAHGNPDHAGAILRVHPFTHAGARTGGIAHSRASCREGTMADPQEQGPLLAAARQVVGLADAVHAPGLGIHSGDFPDFWTARVG